MMLLLHDVPIGIPDWCAVVTDCNLRKQPLESPCTLYTNTTTSFMFCQNIASYCSPWKWIGSFYWKRPSIYNFIRSLGFVNERHLILIKSVCIGTIKNSSNSGSKWKLIFDHRDLFRTKRNYRNNYFATNKWHTNCVRYWINQICHVKHLIVSVSCFYTIFHVKISDFCDNPLFFSQFILYTTRFTGIVGGSYWFHIK